jgi:protein-L-isoaspartate(D-aspartate) O-methyltransferase
MESIQAVRNFYARLVVGIAGSTDQRLISAFASVGRERYVGESPWPIWVGSGYLAAPSDDPAFLYQDFLVGLATNRKINNGQPSLHAQCLSAVAPAKGESVVHIGAGTGYYTEILATLVGSSGKVAAYEVERDLSERAHECLKHLSHVEVVGESASENTIPEADVIYVNAGVTHPLPSWLDAIKIGGRLLFPLTPDSGYGGMVLVTRRRNTVYAAEVVMRAAFIPCYGARDKVTSESVAEAFDTKAMGAVRSLRRDEPPNETAWCIGEGWWLSTAVPS